MEIDNFKMVCDNVSFIVNKDAIGRLVEIKLVNRGHTTMTDICEFDFLSDGEWHELDRLTSVLSDILMCNAR